MSNLKLILSAAAWLSSMPPGLRDKFCDVDGAEEPEENPAFPCDGPDGIGLGGWVIGGVGALWFVCAVPAGAARVGLGRCNIGGCDAGARGAVFGAVGEIGVGPGRCKIGGVETLGGVPAD